MCPSRMPSSAPVPMLSSSTGILLTTLITLVIVVQQIGLSHASSGNAITSNGKSSCSSLLQVLVCEFICWFGLWWWCCWLLSCGDNWCRNFGQRELGICTGQILARSHPRMCFCGQASMYSLWEEWGVRQLSDRQTVRGQASDTVYY